MNDSISGAAKSNKELKDRLKALEVFTGTLLAIIMVHIGTNIYIWWSF